MNNLANAYIKLKKYDEAEALYFECITINQANSTPDRLFYNYYGLADLYEKTGNFESALTYFKRYHNLEDSIIGLKTQNQIADLETKYQQQEQELNLQKSQSQLTAAKHRLKQSRIIAFFCAILVGLGLLYWYRERRNTRAQLVMNKENLHNLTQILIHKNIQLAKLEQEVSNQTTLSQAYEFGENLYHQRILTSEDWVIFKGHFEKTYPQYIARMRASFTTLTEAEERLFLLIKLRLTSKEIAAILGISSESVKKTRNRLRKRLELEKTVALDSFIEAF
jgi:DNA-binding CsgD family transcriptional regulator